jgi:hypothetical protein
MDLQQIVTDLEKKNGPYGNLVCLCDAIEETKWARKQGLDVSDLKDMIVREGIKCLTPIAAKKRGRPKKAQPASVTLAKEPKKRGRPKKVVEEPKVESRGASSLTPMDLTEDEASVIDEALENHSARPKIELEKVPEAEDVIQTDYGDGRLQIVYTPGGQCPIKLNSTALEDVRDWAEQVRNYGVQNRTLYDRSALRYYVRYFYAYGTQEHKTVCEILNAICPSVEIKDDLTPT